MKKRIVIAQTLLSLLQQLCLGFGCLVHVSNTPKMGVMLVTKFRHALGTEVVCCCFLSTVYKSFGLQLRLP